MTRRGGKKDTDDKHGALDKGEDHAQAADEQRAELVQRYERQCYLHPCVHETKTESQHRTNVMHHVHSQYLAKLQHRAYEQGRIWPVGGLGTSLRGGQIGMRLKKL